MDPQVRAIVAHALFDYDHRGELSLQCRLKLELTTYAQKETLCELVIGVKDSYRVSVPMLLYVLDYHYKIDLLQRFRMACRLGLPIDTSGLPAGWAVAGLGAAARSGHLRTVKELLAAGAHPLPGLCGAAYAGHEKVLKYLLLQHPASEAGPAMKSAAQAGRLEIVQLLLNSGVPVSADDITEAVNGDYLEIVRLLLPHLEGDHAHQRLLLGSARSMGMIQLLTSCFPEQLTHRMLEKLLHNAAHRGRQELFHFAVTHGAPLFTLHTRGYTVGIGGSVDILMYLQSEMEGQLLFYEHALTSAVCCRNHDMMEYILGLGLGLDVNEALNQGSQLAANDQQPWLLPRLLAVPGPKNLQTALVSACRYGHLENVRLLLEAGATVSDEAIEAASEFYPEVIELLQTYTA